MSRKLHERMNCGGGDQASSSQSSPEKMTDVSLNKNGADVLLPGDLVRKGVSCASETELLRGCFGPYLGQSPHDELVGLACLSIDVKNLCPSR